MFTFGLITDTHIRPSQGDDSSPYAVNDLANGRAKYACQLLAKQNAAFNMHLGDMVHTLPHLPTYPDACEEAHRIFAPLKPNLYFVPGNHDVGDKPMETSPAGPVDSSSMEIYEKHFGKTWHSFEHQDCLIMTINSSLINTGASAEVQQREWIESTLSSKAGMRVFLFSHYPPFINTANEPDHYDNYAEPGRSWFLSLTKKYNIEAIFSGHVHQFFFNRYGNTKLYCMPPTSFTRQDFSELYRTNPADEYGRNDIGKFSVALVDVKPDGHSVRVLPTNGNTSDQNYLQNKAVSPIKEDSPITVHLRHAWYEAIDLPFNGPMEEFSRKRARNDYTLMRLWQMGIQSVRTPLADLIDPASRKRILDFASTGIRFTFFSLNLPSTETLVLLNQHSNFIDALELIVPDTDFSKIFSEMEALNNFDGQKVHIGKAHSSANEKIKGTKFAHNVSFGFLPNECDQILASVNADVFGRVIKGIVFQANLIDDISELAHTLSAKFTSTRLKPVINVRLAPASPADGNFDDDLIAERVLEVERLAIKYSPVSFQLDTFSDIDRGYSPRHGLVDKLYNLRTAGLALANYSNFEHIP